MKSFKKFLLEDYMIKDDRAWFNESLVGEGFGFTNIEHVEDEQIDEDLDELEESELEEDESGNSVPIDKDGNSLKVRLYDKKTGRSKRVNRDVVGQMIKDGWSKMTPMTVYRIKIKKSTDKNGKEKEKEIVQKKTIDISQFEKYQAQGYTNDSTIAKSSGEVVTDTTRMINGDPSTIKSVDPIERRKMLEAGWRDVMKIEKMNNDGSYDRIEIDPRNFSSYESRGYTAKWKKVKLIKVDPETKRSASPKYEFVYRNPEDMEKDADGNIAEYQEGNTLKVFSGVQVQKIGTKENKATSLDKDDPTYREEKVQVKSRGGKPRFDKDGNPITKTLRYKTVDASELRMIDSSDLDSYIENGWEEGWTKDKDAFYTSFAIQTSNTKLGAHVGNFSLPPGLTCPTDAPCQTEGCYAKKQYEQYPDCKSAWNKNLQLLKTHPDWFVRDMDNFFRTDGAGITKFRWSVAGDLILDKEGGSDIQSSDYLRMINEVAKHNGHIKFWIYTKCYDLLGGFTPRKNLKVIISEWNDYKFNTVKNLAKRYPVAYLDDWDHKNLIPKDTDPGVFICPCADDKAGDMVDDKHCETCKMHTARKGKEGHPCYDLQPGECVIFRKH